MAGLLIAFLWMVIYAVLVAAIIYGVIYVMGLLGFPPPAIVVKLLWIAFGLFVLILAISFLVGHLPPMPRVVGLFLPHLVSI